ncbi:GAF domain-containing protein, partial [Deinococcus sp.]|uniref:GAF domain-containing protein n=1 Tax=Deinococcus sp. TaxID=47478 RepID=UPI0025B9D43F
MLFSPTLTSASTVQQFGAALVKLACEQSGAHGVQFWLAGDGPLTVTAQEGRGLGLSDGALALRALAGGSAVSEGMLSAVPIGGAVLEFVGASPEAVQQVCELAPLLGLALEGVQAREARRGSGRIAQTVEALVRRLGGSLDLAEVLTKTAESAAMSLGFGRAFVALFSEFGESELGAGQARTGEVFTHGFDENFTGGIGVGPVSFEKLVRRGEAIRFERARDAGSALSQGLAELNPEAAVIAPLSARGRALGLLYVDSLNPGATTTDDDARLVLALA